MNISNQPPNQNPCSTLNFNNPKKLFCRKCGSQKIDVECAYFDEYTGEKVHQLTCPNQKCESYCDFWGHYYKRFAWWHRDVECKRCGYRPLQIGEIIEWNF